MSVEGNVRGYILENFLFTDASSSVLADSDSFLDKGIIDSTGILEVIYFLEDEFGISVEDDEMIPENLDSVANIAAFINRKNGR